MDTFKIAFLFLVFFSLTMLFLHVFVFLFFSSWSSLSFLDLCIEVYL